jgi:8-oxo-dGTP pyrophosphatase MutT (NUDIX family)
VGEASPADLRVLGRAASRPAFHAKSRLLTARTAAGTHPNCRPRDAATLIIVDESEGEARVLMGQRHLDHKFMPGKFVFPGGRVEPQDYTAAPRFPVHLPVATKLLRALKGIPHLGRARALVNAALRETQEETGLILSASAAGDDAPGPAALAFLARAITPPGRPRRFDTRFFVLPASAIAERTEIVDGEFAALAWFSLAQARDADLPLITRVILDELEDGLKSGLMAGLPRAVPFYFKRGACFHRLEL